MDSKNKLFSAIVIILILLVVLGGIYFLFIKQSSVENLKFKEVKQEDAKQALLNGDIDIYAGSLSVNDIKELEGNSAVTLYPATSTMLGLFMNPYPSIDKFNPFSIKDVRYAMQFLVNREDLANDLFAGFAKPTVTVPWSEHPDYQNIKDTVDKMGISYNKEKAISLIKSGMESAGAVLESNIWVYKEQPVNVIVSYYKGDKTSVIANLFKNSLEEVGFGVTLVETDGGDPNAEAPEDNTDAAELKWNVAIGGWIYYSQSQISNTAILEPYVDSGWWKYNNEEISALEERLNNFKTEDERTEINNALAQKYLEDSTCVWLLAAESVSAARSEVKGLIQDKFVGISNYTNIREAYIPGKDTLVVGLPKTYGSEEAWNHWVVNDINMMYILNTVHDPEIWNNTETLEYSGFRWPFTIQGEDANSIIDIPEDSYFWDVDSKKWTAVEKDKKAVTKVTYDLAKYVGTNWQDGEAITWADVVYNIARSWDVAYDTEKLKVDDNTRHYNLDPIIGLRISGNNLEVYLNKWSSDKYDLLGLATLFQRAAPWELYAATDDIVFNQRLYNYQYLYGSDKKDLNVANSDHVADIFKTLGSFDFAKVESMMTIGDTVYAQKSDLDSRVNSLREWYSSHGHLYINDGPFYIDSFDSSDNSINLKAFHDKSYPFSRGYWRK
jgi:peptide/nickel transport system substrate-binding protein